MDEKSNEKKPSERLSDIVRERCRESSDSSLVEAAIALADCFDEAVAQMDRLFQAFDPKQAM